MKTPITASEWTCHAATTLKDAEGNVLAECSCSSLLSKASADVAAEIVRRVNVHDELLAALVAVRKLLEKNVTFIGGGPESHVRVPFESHDQSWNHWHEARDLTRAAIAGATK